MNDCEELSKELEDLKWWYRWEIIFCILKALLGLFGLDWAVDVLRKRKTFKEAFGPLEAFLAILLTLDIVAVIMWLKDELPGLLEKLPLGETVKQQLKKLLGPVALIFLIVDLAFAVKGFFDCREIALKAYNNRVKEIYNFYECRDKDRIFREMGIEIPQ